MPNKKVLKPNKLLKINSYMEQKFLVIFLYFLSGYYATTKTEVSRIWMAMKQN